MSIPRVQIGNCTLYCGDALDILPTLSRVDALVTDPPYGVALTGKRGHYRHRGTVMRDETYASYEDTQANFERRVLPALTLALATADTAGVFMNSRQLSRLPPMDDVGGFFLPNGCGLGRWGFQTFMHVALYGKDPHRTNGARPNGRYGLYGNDANQIAHPCAKPLAAVQWVVERVSLEGASVLDPFMGSGTTGVACAALGRSFVGIELDPTYFALACERITQAIQQLALFPMPARAPAAQQLALEGVA